MLASTTCGRRARQAGREAAVSRAKMSDGYGALSMTSDVATSLYSWLLSLCCSVACTTSSVKVNNRTLRVVKMLAEGGFSFVYLVECGAEKFALKKVLAQLPEQSELANWEIKVLALAWALSSHQCGSF